MSAGVGFFKMARALQGLVWPCDLYPCERDPAPVQSGADSRQTKSQSVLRVRAPPFGVRYVPRVRGPPPLRSESRTSHNQATPANREPINQTTGQPTTAPVAQTGAARAASPERNTACRVGYTAALERASAPAQAPASSHETEQLQ